MQFVQVPPELGIVDADASRARLLDLDDPDPRFEHAELLGERRLPIRDDPEMPVELCLRDHDGAAAHLEPAAGLIGLL